MEIDDKEHNEDFEQELEPDQVNLASSPVLGLQKGARNRGRGYGKGKGKIHGKKLKIRGDIPVKPSKKTHALRLARRHRNMNEMNSNGDLNIETEPPLVEHQALNHIASAFFLMIADSCTKATKGDLWPLLEGMLQLLQPTTFMDSSSIGASSSMATDSLENLALRLGQIEKNLTGFNFIYMLDTIQLRSKVVR